ncbi:RNA polymerase Rpb4 family protein [Acidianus brierleyi]|uniref:DNA-directed RNA polymerase subunit Rpo4 n=1 Tax=Acidianus brierleyi TaxID=41673 RepID=A0A2U9IEG0_9CREN|nr:RNA polymerase Rpb4 family protein [Acidianus brierleyi]AWR94428.1 DNA-directed RNA polymerase subunit F [Acidianus brierleyi]
MSSESIIDEHYISYSEAKKYIYEIIKSGLQSPMIQRVYEYLNNVEKCSNEDVSSLLDEIKPIIEKEEVLAMIASICPTTIDELRAILVIDNKTYSNDDLEKVIESIKKHLKS